MREKFMATIATILFLFNDEDMLALFSGHKLFLEKNDENTKYLPLDQMSLYCIYVRHRCILNFIMNNCRECDLFNEKNMSADTLKNELLLMLKHAELNLFPTNFWEDITLTTLVEIREIRKSILAEKFTLTEFAEKMLEVGYRTRYDIEDWELFGHNPVAVLLLWLQIKRQYAKDILLEPLTIDKIELRLNIWMILSFNLPNV